MNIKKELTKGSSAMLVLSVLEKEELYGYMIIKRISERSDNTFNFNYVLFCQIVQSSFVSILYPSSVIATVCS